MQMYNKYKNVYEKDQQTNKLFDKLYRNSLQDSVIDKKEYECLGIIFTKYLDETRTESFYKKECKNKIKLFQ